MRYLQFSLLFTLITAYSLCVAGSNPMPSHCKPDGFKFKSNLLILHTVNITKPELYLFYNKSGQRLVLGHPHPPRGASAGWDSMLHAKKWSAFIVNRPKFAIICTPIKKSDAIQSSVNCEKMLTVCRYLSIKINNPMMNGTFWVAEDGDIIKIQDKIKKRGITMPRLSE